MQPLRLAGLAGLAALGAHAQGAPVLPVKLESLVVTATRTLQPVESLRDAVVITRDDLESMSGLSLGEVLQRRAGLELRANGGPGQPQGLFIRGAGAANTLVLVDGMRAGSASAGTTPLENIPVEMIERIEVVKGPLSSLYGSEAAGGVIQIFTRGKEVPYLFASAGYGSDRDRRAAAGLSTSDGTNLVSLSAGMRKVDAASATNPRSFVYAPDRDPHENAFATLHASHKLWQGETLALDVFGSGSRTRFDAGTPLDPATPEDRNDQSNGGARFTSSTHFAPWWQSRLWVASARDKEIIRGQFPGTFETRQDQAAWVNELTAQEGTLVAGLETLRQKVLPADAFAHTQRDTNSGFVSLVQRYAGQQFEASARRDRDDQFGDRNTGSVSYGFDWPSVARLSGTWAHGFRAPTFNDLYGPSYPGFYVPNPELKPERSYSREVSVASLGAPGVQWKVTAFDNRLDDLIVFSPAALTVLNVSRARIRGVEASVEGSAWGARWRAQLTAQRPRDETPRDDGLQPRLQGRAERFGSFEASRAFGRFTAGVTVFASGDRFDSTDQSPGTRLGGYALVDARVAYKVDRNWSLQLTANNLGDKRYESTFGYDAPRRSVFLNVRFESY